MANKNGFLLNYAVPILALLVVVVQFFLVSENNLTRWKGGGFGMYSEMHFNDNEVIISNLEIPLDSLKKSNKNIAIKIKRLKRMPSSAYLEEFAQMISNYSLNDTLTVQVWRPVLNSKSARYTRELINEFHYIQPWTSSTK